MSLVESARHEVDASSSPLVRNLWLLGKICRVASSSFGTGLHFCLSYRNWASVESHLSIFPKWGMLSLFYPTKACLSYRNWASVESHLSIFPKWGMLSLFYPTKVVENFARITIHE